MKHFFPKQGVYGFAREQEDVRIVTVVNAASETRELPWPNIAPWVADARQTMELQADGSRIDVLVREGDRLEPWEHRVWIVQK